MEFETQINEASLCKGKEILKGTHQSPDGLCVIKTDKLLEMVPNNCFIDKSIFDKEYLKVLIEQKAPAIRKPIKDSIPDKYIP